MRGSLFFQQFFRYHAAVCVHQHTPATTLTGSSRTTGTPDTVDIIFRYCRQFIVDDVRQLFDIQTARSDIGRHLSTRMSPDLKSASARVRAPCDLFPWIAALRMPSLLSCSARWLAPCLVRVNTSTCCQFPLPIMCDSNSRLRFLSTK